MNWNKLQGHPVEYSSPEINNLNIKVLPGLCRRGPVMTISATVACGGCMF